jgi:hypothetical protein
VISSKNWGISRIITIHLSGKFPKSNLWMRDLESPAYLCSSLSTLSCTTPCALCQAVHRTKQLRNHSLTISIQLPNAQDSQTTIGATTQIHDDDNDKDDDGQSPVRLARTTSTYPQYKCQTECSIVKCRTDGDNCIVHSLA